MINDHFLWVKLLLLFIPLALVADTTSLVIEEVQRLGLISIPGLLLLLFRVVWRRREMMVVQRDDSGGCGDSNETWVLGQNRVFQHNLSGLRFGSWCKNCWVKMFGGFGEWLMGRRVFVSSDFITQHIEFWNHMNGSGGNTRACWEWIKWSVKQIIKLSN